MIKSVADFLSKINFNIIVRKNDVSNVIIKENIVSFEWKNHKKDVFYIVITVISDEYCGLNFYKMNKNLDYRFYKGLEMVDFESVKSIFKA